MEDLELLREQLKEAEKNLERMNQLVIDLKIAIMSLESETVRS
jgi:hypothetical protein